MAGGKIRVLIADAHGLFREGVASLLERAGDVELIGEAATGEEAIRLAADLLPDVVLMDLKMPGIGGIEATRTIVGRSPRVCPERRRPRYATAGHQGGRARRGPARRARRPSRAGSVLRAADAPSRSHAL